MERETQQYQMKSVHYMWSACVVVVVSGILLGFLKSRTGASGRFPGSESPGAGGEVITAEPEPLTPLNDRSISSRAGVYKSDMPLLEIVYTSEREIVFRESGPWVELGKQSYQLNDTYSFETDDAHYHVDFLDPDPNVMTLTRRVKPFTQPPKRDYLQARKASQ